MIMLKRFSALLFAALMVSALGCATQSEPQSPGALRVVYIEQQTGRFSREFGKRITQRLASTDTASAAELARRYRVEPSAVPHGYVGAVCGPVLLADPGADFDWSRIV